MKKRSLSEIWIYPIKSLGGTKVERAKVQPKGLELDRRWMLVDAVGKFITQRTCPQMALFRVQIDNTLLVVNQHQPGGRGSSISFEQDTLSNKTLTATIFDDTVETVEVHPDLSQWFSFHLGFPCTLVRFPEENPRRVDVRYAVNNDHVSLADAYPYLVIGQSSLNDLNARMMQSLPINRFRPNFVFTDGEPFEEDTWKNISIGTTRFAGVKPCARCTIPTIDHETGVKGMEPTVTLARYRKLNNNIYFGQNLIALEPGEVNVGDEIVVHEFKPSILPSAAWTSSI